MSKILTYYRRENEGYLASSDEFDYVANEFEYVVDDEDLLNAVTELVYNQYFSKNSLSKNPYYQNIVKKGIREMLEEMEDFDGFADSYDELLSDLFYADAMNNKR